MMWPMNWVLLIPLLVMPFLQYPLRAQPCCDSSSANLSTLWTNGPNLGGIQPYYDSDGTMVRPILKKESSYAACGFFCKGKCDVFLFAIFIGYVHNSTEAKDVPHVVWSANRNHPVRENATLQFTQDGDLILRDADNTTVWSTHTSGKSVVGMALKGAGSLVLVDENNLSVWESFDHPTDSLVVGQTLAEGQRLTASISLSNWTEGQFSLAVSSYGLEAYINSNPPQLYYKVVRAELGNFTSLYFDCDDDETGETRYFGYYCSLLLNYEKILLPLKSEILVSNTSFVKYIKLESNGHFRLYEWDVVWHESGNVLNVTGGDCGYPLVCGYNGICSKGKCSCPRGSDRDSTYFREVYDKEARLGCSLVTPLSCQSTQAHLLLALGSVSYFNYKDLDAALPNRTNVESCKQACLMNCSCKAAFFRYSGDISDGYCFLPSQLFSLMSNLPEVSDYYSDAYIKVQLPPTLPSPPPTSEKKSVGSQVILGSVLGALFGAFLIIGIVFIIRRNKRVKEEDHFCEVPGMPTRFPFEELKVATENFCRKLGEGGFGSVFEGALSDGMRVAVKCLEGIGQGKKEFLAEVETIGTIHHITLVKLIGFCAEKSYRLLVYEYMCNGSLDKWIFYRNQNSALDWQTRFKIFTDIAKGLVYLHEECRQRIAHLDIKPQNILLDEKFNAKVSDFGLAKLIDRDLSRVMTRMRGTQGYMAPEWLTSQITEKVDVYSFGVVVLEIVWKKELGLF